MKDTHGISELYFARRRINRRNCHVIFPSQVTRFCGNNLMGFIFTGKRKARRKKNVRKLYKAIRCMLQLGDCTWQLGGCK